MADLPDFRVNQSPVFSHVGIDFAGPFNTKASPLRNAKTYKGYLAVFVCLSVKAVHLEYITGLSTHDFLSAFDRFTSRRGLPAHMYSDNGLNFVGASNHLKEVYTLLSSSQEEIQCHLSDRKIEWHHNVPLGSNFGGIWEAAVKSAKRLLQSVIHELPYTYEEYNTLFTRIEATLNSRPILDFSPDPTEEIQLLTPGHFLIGRPLLQPLEVPFTEEDTPRLKWDRIRQITQVFWKRWLTEYLHTLSQRQRWAKNSPPIQIDQIVLMCGINSPPMSWPIGRIVELHPGKDEVTRVMTIKTATGLYKRPVNHLILLPVA